MESQFLVSTYTESTSQTTTSAGMTSLTTHYYSQHNVTLAYKIHSNLVAQVNMDPAAKVD